MTAGPVLSFGSPEGAYTVNALDFESGDNPMMTDPHEEFTGHESDLRQLALVDRIIGLEAEVAHLKTITSTELVRQQLDAVRSSATWRVGRAVLAPLTLVKRVVNGRRL